MNDLFRFVVLRPAVPVDPGLARKLTPSFTSPGSDPSRTRKEARSFLQRKPPADIRARLKFGAAAASVTSRLRRGRATAEEIDALVKESTGKTAKQVVSDASFATEETLLADTLAAMKLLSDSSGGDAPGLARALQGYDAIRATAEGSNEVVLRVLFAEGTGKAGPAEEPSSPEVPPTPGKERESMERSLDEVETALTALGALTASAFPTPDQPPFLEAESLETVGRSAGAPPSALSSPGVANTWVLSSSAVSGLPARVRTALSRYGIDLSRRPLPTVVDQLHVEKTRLQGALFELAQAARLELSKFGNFLAPTPPPEYVGTPTVPLPTGHGNLSPAGIGDLLMVKQHIKRYEGGELAHVENVLRSESLSRETKRLERTETTVLQETESTKEESRDTQTTDRFSLQRETAETIKHDSSLKAGLSVSAKYGPVVEVKANTEFATSTSSESATKQASEFSKDVIERSASKLVQRVLERRSVTTISEFEEHYSHGFDNKDGTAHISGVYQWIDKVLQAQVYNYGKRLLFDVTVPEPATNFVLAQSLTHDPSRTVEKPVEFTVTAASLNEGNYLVWAQKYDATGLEPPPPPVKTVVKTFDGTFPDAPHMSTKSETLPIEDGYRAKYVSFVKTGVFHSGRAWVMLVGTTWYDAVTADQYRDLAGEVGSIGLSYLALQFVGITATLEIFCERTDRAYRAWQLKVHATITQAYLAKVQAHEQAMAEARVAAGTVMAGRNPEFNQRFISGELRKQCLTLLTGQQFEAFGALELSPEGYAQPNLARSAAQMPYVRFFEQAFEWEHIVYHFYPYFWGWKGAWKNRLLLDDVDPTFGDFLRAGAGRIVFPVRPGFEAAVVHYLETGEIWNGGPPPELTSPLYVPIIQEIQEASGAPGSETPVGEPWDVRLPTTLVRLRPNDDLPKWQKVGESWQPVDGFD